LFWTDSWIHGKRISDLAPQVFALVSCFPDSSPSLLTCFFLYGCYNRGLEQTPCSGLTVGFMAKGSVTLRPKFLHWSKREELAGLYTRPSQIICGSLISKALNCGSHLKFLSVWDLVKDVILQPGVTDYHIWWLSSKGQYSARPAYKNLFQETNSFCPYTRIWKSWAPGKYKFFLWLVAAAQSCGLSYLVVIFKGPIFSKVGLQKSLPGNEFFSSLY
jgi:hypothetical protein